MISLFFLDASLWIYAKLKVAKKYYDPEEKWENGKNKGIFIRPTGSF